MSDAEPHGDAFVRQTSYNSNSNISNKKKLLRETNFFHHPTCLQPDTAQNAVLFSTRPQNVAPPNSFYPSSLLGLRVKMMTNAQLDAQQALVSRAETYESSFGLPD